jgi:tetratricopeptide (TPR) repeat protein
VNKCEEALLDFNKACELDGNLYRAAAGRAYCLGATGKYTEAISEASRAIALDGGKPSAYYSRGMAEYKLRNFRDALRDLNQAIELGMSTAAAFYSRAAARDINDDWVGAIGDYTRAIELDPNNWRGFSGRGIARRSYGDYIGSVADFTRGLELAPDQRKLIVDRSWAKLLNYDNDGALSDILEYFGSEGSGHKDAPYLSIIPYIALRRMGKSEEARTFVRKALIRSAEDAYSFRSRFLLDEVTEEKLLELAKENKNDLTSAHALIGIKLLLDGDRTNAVRHFKWDQENGSHEVILHQLARTEYARLTGNPRLLTPKNPDN